MTDAKKSESPPKSEYGTPQWSPDSESLESLRTDHEGARLNSDISMEPPNSNGPYSQMDLLFTRNDLPRIPSRIRHRPLQRSLVFLNRMELTNAFQESIDFDVNVENRLHENSEELPVSAEKLLSLQYDVDGNEVQNPTPGTSKAKNKTEESAEELGTLFMWSRPMSLHLPRPTLRVFALMYNLKSYFYSNENSPNRERIPKVKFPEEVVEKAEIHGDRAGKDRVVTHSAHPPRGRRKLRKVYDKSRNRTIIDPEIQESFQNEEHSGCFEEFLQKYIYNNCGNADVIEVVDPANPKKLSQKYRKATITFRDNLEVAGDYIDGNMKSLRVIELQTYFPPESVEATENLNYVSAQIWLCTFGIQHLFQTKDGKEEEIPTRFEFEELVEKLEHVQKRAEEMSEEAIRFSELLGDYGKEALSLMSKAAKLYGVKLDTSMPKPVKLRGGLKILKKKKQKQNKDKLEIDYKVMARPKLGAKPKWGNFNQFPVAFKLYCLGHLADTANESVRIIRAHLQFLSDDIVHGKFDEHDPPFTTVLILLYDLLKYFKISKETTKFQLDNLTDIVSMLSADIRDFYVRAREITIRIMEIRDMSQLCFDFMKEEYTINSAVARLESKVFKKKKMKRQEIWNSFKSCCGKKVFRKNFHYSVEDFMMTDYTQALRFQSIPVGIAQLMIKPVDDHEMEEAKEKVDIRFAEPEERVIEDALDLSQLDDVKGNGGQKSAELGTDEVKIILPQPGSGGSIHEPATKITRTASSSSRPSSITDDPTILLSFKQAPPPLQPILKIRDPSTIDTLPDPTGSETEIPQRTRRPRPPPEPEIPKPEKRPSAIKILNVGGGPAVMAQSKNKDNVAKLKSPSKSEIPEGEERKGKKNEPLTKQMSLPELKRAESASGVKNPSEKTDKDKKK